MADIRDEESALEGQIGYKGPAFIAHLFTANNREATEKDP
jgi:hypothetical protein